MIKILLKPIILLLILLELNSCGMPIVEDFLTKNVSEVRKYTSTDPTFDLYASKFVEAGKIQLKDSTFNISNIPINFGNTDQKSNVGLCVKYSDGTKEILIKKTWWDSAPELLKESLIFHELGHCKLNRKHDNSLLTLSTAETIKSTMMNKVIVNPTPYTKYKAQYIEELFTSNKTTLKSAFGI